MASNDLQIDTHKQGHLFLLGFRFSFLTIMIMSLGVNNNADLLRVSCINQLRHLGIFRIYLFF